MPDVHARIGATEGTVIPTRSAIIPAATGVDKRFAAPGARKPALKNGARFARECPDGVRTFGGLGLQ